MCADEDRAMAFVREASLGSPGQIKNVADYLLQELGGISSLTMGEVAARSLTSKPTLVRFAKLAGYRGWTGFRRDFLGAALRVEHEQAARASVDVNHPFASGDSMTLVRDSLVRICELSAEEVGKSVEAHALEAAADAMLRAHTLVFLGAAQNQDRGRIFASTLSHIGILCHVPTIDDAPSVLRLLRDRDCVIAASYSGSLAHQPFLGIDTLTQRHVTTIAVTNSRHSQLADVATLTLSFAPLEHLHDKYGPFYSGCATSLILDMLVGACYARRFDASRSAQASVLKDLDGTIPAEFPDAP